MLGMSYLQKKDYDKAASAFQRLLQVRPNDVTAKYDLGLAYGSSKRFEEARQIFAELTRLDPNNDDFWQLLGSSLKELHRPTDAEGALRKAVDLNAQNFAAYRDLGWVKLELGNADAALDAFEHAATLEPNDADSQLGIARAYSAKHMEKESGAALERYNELRSSGTPATAGRF
jgi:Flp pilus assembly protein TadD